MYGAGHWSVMMMKHRPNGKGGTDAGGSAGNPEQTRKDKLILPARR